MDLVTITDHDSLDGCLEVLDRLGDLPDFITGEEVSATFPEFNRTVHLGVYGLNEAQHREIQRLRSNAQELVPYLRQQNLLFVLSHFFWPAQRSSVALQFGNADGTLTSGALSL
jgi:predicted metal-dependent phosphoesterase TrpH